MRSSSFFPSSSNRHSSTFKAFAENKAKFTPRPSQVAPSGCGDPSRTRDFRIAGGIDDLACGGRNETKKGGLPPPFHDGNASGCQAAENIADSHSNQRGDDGLRLDQVAELPRRLLRLAGRLVVQPLRLGPGITAQVADRFLCAAAELPSR